jgi:hypothetical protein
VNPRFNFGLFLILIETNMIVSFEEMHGLYSEFQAILYANLCYYITAEGFFQFLLACGFSLDLCF